MTDESPAAPDATVGEVPGRPIDRQRVLDLCAAVALVWGGVYVAWRAITTLDGAHPATALVLLAAEALGLCVFAARVRSARRRPVEFLDVPGVPCPDVTAVVDATGATVVELRTTLLALHRVEGLGPVHVVERRDSASHRRVGERLGAVVQPPDLGVEDTLTRASSSWALLVRAGDLPTPDLVAMAAAPCSAPDVGVVLVGLEEADPTTFEPKLDGRWTTEPFTHQVVRPSLAAAGSIPWYDDGPALVNRAAVERSGGWAPGESRLEVGSRLVRDGSRVALLPLTLARTQAPAGLGEQIAMRQQATGAHVRGLMAGVARGLPRSASTAHLLVLTPVVAAVQRVLLLLSAVLVLGFGTTPLEASTPSLAVLAAPAYALRWVTHLRLGRGKLARFSVLRSELRTFAADLAPFGRWSRRTARRAGWTALVAVIAALDAGVVVAAWSVWRDWPDRPPPEITVAAIVLSAVLAGVAMEVAIDVVLRDQRRATRRVRLGLVTCRLEELDGQLVDLSTGGAGVVVPCPVQEAPEPGAVTTLSFRIPDADGAWRSVTALVVVAHRCPDAEGGTRIGVRFEDPIAAPLDPVVEFLTIDRRLVALGRHRLEMSGRLSSG